jgi:hypothetical protein
MPGSYNDINVLQRSPLFAKFASGESTPVEFQAKEWSYNIGYYLADGIHPKWDIFLKLISNPQGKKELRFHNDGAYRKYVERFLGFYQPKFGITR